MNGSGCVVGGGPSSVVPWPATGAGGGHMTGAAAVCVAPRRTASAAATALPLPVCAAERATGDGEGVCGWAHPAATEKPASSAALYHPLMAPPPRTLRRPRPRRPPVATAGVGGR